MALTVTEKEHWKERIARKIDKKIESVCASDASFLDRIDRQARERALESLGLTQLQADLKRAEEEEEALERRQDRIRREMLAIVQKVPVEEVDPSRYYNQEHPDITRAIQRRHAVHLDELLGEHPLGQVILRLRREKEDLLDTIWLATSSRQIKELWKRMAELLGEQASPLQEAALAMEPATAE